MNTTVSTSCGFHAVQNALNHPETVEVLLYDVERNDLRLKELTEQARRSQIQIRASGKKELDKVSAGVRHQGVIIIHTIDLAKPSLPLEEYLTQLEAVPLLLVLDGVQDPQNLGACLRTAAAAGVDGVILPRKKGCDITATVIRVAAGGMSHLSVFEESNWNRVMTTLKNSGLWIVGTDERAENDIYSADLVRPVALVLGAEDKGMRRLTRKQCDHVVRIPAVGGIHSLNVSVATGIALFEALRQRRALL
ncbi:MAG TPA: 23S rRNA (guanosine(2251)-2'-O)-methyltransferase RlmB [Gammaproteobacteria bacterium]|jgi:23S rRNA (guanosine2251-2'-O)-methyltransferase|nr:23S rRNA (guanosine(2251)-2'-O)-methyltransferase RlmB [Gammaproteobacteria bacterium]HIM05750.1 23S rRNA (guanosine(2251)-2'-O)-methyltransferase RlmB [Gammaproteobacteria bacterium]